eukprot:GHVP01014898.1.p1 GENE.GHVP01014898.1~~GHVP01014898.1.p1  ORF type:complete len:244 (+),score=42.38 GHVP01014898.1:59-733(+)
MEFFGKLSEELTNTFVRPYATLVEPDEEESGGLDFRANPFDTEEDYQPPLKKRNLSFSKVGCRDSQMQEILNSDSSLEENINAAQKLKGEMEEGLQHSAQQQAEEFCQIVKYLIMSIGLEGELQKALDSVGEKVRFTLDEGNQVTLWKTKGEGQSQINCSCGGACNCTILFHDPHCCNCPAAESGEIVKRWFIDDNHELYYLLLSNSMLGIFIPKKFWKSQFCI